MLKKQKPPVRRALSAFQLFSFSAFFFVSLSAFSANVRLYFPARTNTAVLLTNQVKALPISPNILSSGGVVGIGLPFNINFPTNGVATNFFARGFYALTNNLLGQGGIVINVTDDGPALYDYTNLLWSGYNTYAGIFGTNLPPTYNQLTNALGFLPLTALQTTGAVNTLIVQSNLVNTTTLNSASNALQSQINTATNAGITAQTATNIARVQATNAAAIATNDLNTVLRALIAAGDLAVSNGVITFATNATNSLNTVLRALINNATNLIWQQNFLTQLEAGVVLTTPFYLTNTTGTSNAWVLGIQTGSGALTFKPPNSNSIAMEFEPGGGIYPNGDSSSPGTRAATFNDVTNAVGASTNSLNTALVARIAGATNQYIRNSFDTNTEAAARAVVTNIVNAIGGAASQTPWLSDINGAQKSLTNAAAVTAGSLTATGAVSAAGATAGISVAGRFFSSTGTDADAVAGASSLIISNGGNGNGLFSGRRNVLGSGSVEAAILSGEDNRIGAGSDNKANDSVILGGQGNFIGNSNGVGDVTSYAIIAGGQSNVVTEDYGFAAGRRSLVTNSGSFAFSDAQVGGTPGIWNTVTNDSFILRFRNGLAINTNNPGTNTLKAIGNIESDATSIGGNPVFIYATNNLSATGAGTPAANGTYVWLSGSVMTNTATGAYITNNSGTRQIVSAAGSVLYTSTTATNPAWTIAAGAANGPATLYGEDLNLTGLNFLGGLTSTNLAARLNGVLKASLEAQSTVATGGTITFTINPAGSGPFTYQWSKDGTDIGGAVNRTLTLAGATSGSAGLYCVRVGQNGYQLTNCTALNVGGAVATDATRIATNNGTGWNLTTHGPLTADSLSATGAVVNGALQLHQPFWSDVWTNETFTGSGSISNNGHWWVPNVLPMQGRAVFYSALDGNSRVIATKYIDVTHGGSPASALNSELVEICYGNAANGWGFQAGINSSAQKILHWQVGIGNQNEAAPAFSQSALNQWIYMQACGSYGAAPGYSTMLTFRSSEPSLGFDKYPGIVGRSFSNSPSYGLSFHWGDNITGTGNGDSWSPTTLNYSADMRTKTDGTKRWWDLRGGQVREKTNVTASAVYALDFGKSAADSVTLSGTNVFYFSTANVHGGTSNFESHVFLLRAAGLDATLNWPATWAFVSALPTSLNSTQMLRVALESWGVGESNIVVASHTAGNDPTFAWDADALSYFTRANITNTFSKVAVNNFVIALKAGNVWTNWPVIYPFAHTNAADDAVNLVSSSYPITWTGTVFPTNGVGFAAGNSAYGDTGFNPSTGWNLNSAAMVAWTPTVSPTAVMAGCNDGSGHYAYINVASGNPNVKGLNGNTDVPVTGGGDLHGFWLGMRTNSTSLCLVFNSAANCDSGATSSARPNLNVFVGARNDTGSPANYFTGNVGLLMLGTAPDSDAKVAALRSAVQTFAAAMNR